MENLGVTERASVESDLGYTTAEVFLDGASRPDPQVARAVRVDRLAVSGERAVDVEELRAVSLLHDADVMPALARLRPSEIVVVSAEDPALTRIDPDSVPRLLVARLRDDRTPATLATAAGYRREFSSTAL